MNRFSDSASEWMTRVEAFRTWEDEMLAAGDHERYRSFHWLLLGWLIADGEAIRDAAWNAARLDFAGGFTFGDLQATLDALKATMRGEQMQDQSAG